MPKLPSFLALGARREPPGLWRIGAGAPPSGAFIALAPGAEAPLIALGLPGALRGLAREEVARRQAQDRLGHDGTALDIRPARLGAREGWTRVAVADRATVARWRSAMGPAAARCRGIVPDYLGLPAAPGLWTMAHDSAGLSVRLGLEDGFSAETALAPHLLSQAVMQARAQNALPRAVLWLGERSAEIDALLGDLTVVQDAAELPAAIRPHLLAHGEETVDFSRDPHAVSAAIERRLRRALWPVVLIALGAAGWAGAAAVSVRNDLATAAALEAATEQAARADLLGSAPILDLQVQVSRAIAQRRAEGIGAPAPDTALDLLRTASDVLTALQADLRADVRSVALGGGIAGLAVDLSVDDFRSLDTLLSDLGQAGLTARLVQSGIDPDGGVAATLTIERGAP